MNSISIICTFASAVLLFPLIVQGGLITKSQSQDAPDIEGPSRNTEQLTRGSIDSPSNYHLNHQHTRSGRCFFTSPGSSPNTWSGSGSGGGFDVFDIDPRLAEYQAQLAVQESLDLPAPIAYQILHRSGDHLALSPITYLSKDDGQQKS